MGNVETSGPNSVKVISGGWCNGESKKYVMGGWGWSWWFVSNVEKLDLNVMTLKPVCEDVETQQGVPLTVTGVAQVKIIYAKKEKNIEDHFKKACEQFIGTSRHQIEEILRQTLEGNLRAILGQLKVEDVYRDRDEFADRVRDTAAPDLARMGIEILSFIIQDVRDDVDYLTDIGKTQIAEVKKIASIGETEATRRIEVTKATCAGTIQKAKMTAETNIDKARRDYDTCKANCQAAINSAKTDAEGAYKLQKAKQDQEIAKEEAEVQVIIKKKTTEIEKAEVLRKAKELEGTERLPAEFNARQVQLLAQGERDATVIIAKNKAQEIKMIGLAEALSSQVIGEAEALALKLKARAMQRYGKQALVQMILESLPSLAAEIASPLSRIDDIILLGGKNDRLSTEVGKIVSEGPAVIKALTGVDVSGTIKRLPGAESVVSKSSKNLPGIESAKSVLKT